jgi:hypothetical protein
MIKHTQNMFGAEGNCWQTVIASLLELPMEEVPDFVNEYEAGGQHWWLHTIDFLKKHDMQIKPIPDHPDTDELYLVSGPSPRYNDQYHVVIYQRGRMVHDPHPDGTGVLEEKHFDIIRKK